jgi:hypothetical protein
MNVVSFYDVHNQCVYQSLTRTCVNLVFLDDCRWIESQKRLFRTFVFQSARYLSSSTNDTVDNTIDFDHVNDERAQQLNTFTKQLVLIEVGDNL